MAASPLRGPPLRMIEAFEALARLGSRSAAAAELNVTPGAISKQLGALERWVGEPLFSDKGRDAELNPAGRRLAEAVTAGLAQIRDGLEALRPPQSEPLNILAPATFAMKWLVPRLYRLEHVAPGLQVTLRPTNTGDDWVKLPHHGAIRRDGFVPAGYESQPLMREKLTAFIARSILREGIAPEDVPLCESGTRQGDLDRWLAAAGIRRVGQKRRRFAHFYIAYAAALAGEGLIVAPDLLAAADVAAERLVAPWPHIEVPGAPVALVFPSTPAMRRRIAPLLGWLRSEIGRDGSAGGRAVLRTG